MSKKALGLVASAALLFSVGAQATVAKTQPVECCESCCPQCHCINYDITIGGGYVEQHSITEERLDVTGFEQSNDHFQVVSKSHTKHGTGEIIFGAHSPISQHAYAVFDFGYRFLGEATRKWEAIYSPASVTVNPGNLSSSVTPLNIHDKYTWNAYLFRVGFMYDFMCSFYGKVLVGAGAVNTKYRIEDREGFDEDGVYGFNAFVTHHRTNFVPAAALALGWNLNCNWGLELSYEHLFGGKVDEPSNTTVVNTNSGSSYTYREDHNVPRFNLINLAINYKF